MYIPHKELIIGGQRSGKTNRAEYLAAQWLQQSPNNQAVYLATAQAHDEEMHARIAYHRQERALRIPSMQTVESTDLTTHLQTRSRPDTAIVLDCLTLWLTQMYFPWQGAAATVDDIRARINAFLDTLAACQAQVYIVSNEIGLGLVAPQPETRAFVDALGLLNQQVAALCNHATFMAAGLPLPLKRP